MAEIRTQWIDYEARRDPKTKFHCCMCQKDLNPSKRFRHVYVDGQMFAIHPEDLAKRPAEPDDFGWLFMGNDCAKRFGIEWTTDAPVEK